MRRDAGLFRTLFAAGCVVLTLYEVWALFIRETPALFIQGERPFAANEFGEGALVSQTFQMLGDGLTAFDLQFSTDRPLTLIVQCGLVQSDVLNPEATRSWFATIKRVSGVEWRRVEFPVVETSDLHQYTLNLQLIAAMPADSVARQAMHDRPLGERPRVALVVSKDNVVGGGLLYIADRRHFGSLSLRAFTHTRRAYQQFRAAALPVLPAPLRVPGVDLAVLAAYQWALLAVVYALLLGDGATTAATFAGTKPR